MLIAIGGASTPVPTQFCHLVVLPMSGIFSSILPHFDTAKPDDVLDTWKSIQSGDPMKFRQGFSIALLVSAVSYLLVVIGAPPQIAVLLPETLPTRLQFPIALVSMSLVPVGTLCPTS